MKEKSFEELTITDDFIFTKVMQNQGLCKKLLEMLLSVKILQITYPQGQKTIDIAYDSKGIRLDVYVDDEKGTIYNIEMQTTRRKNLPKRSRYYQGMIDLDLLEKGADYEELQKSYVIFICTFDPFGKGRHIYTFENICLEDTDIQLKDDSIKVFVNTKGTMQDISQELQGLMDYFNGMTAMQGFAKELHQEVERIKENEDWRREYMTLEMRERERYREGFGDGKEQGIINSIEVVLSLGFDKETALTKVAAQYEMSVDKIQRIWEQRQ